MNISVPKHLWLLIVQPWSGNLCLLQLSQGIFCIWSQLPKSVQVCDFIQTAIFSIPREEFNAVMLIRAEFSAMQIQNVAKYTIWVVFLKALIQQINHFYPLLVKL